MQRVRCISLPRHGIPQNGQEGFLRGPGRRIITEDNETPGERAMLNREYAETHSMILWDGNSHPWNCPNTDFEIIDQEGT